MNTQNTSEEKQSFWQQNTQHKAYPTPLNAEDIIKQGIKLKDKLFVYSDRSEQQWTDRHDFLTQAQQAYANHRNDTLTKNMATMAEDIQNIGKNIQQNHHPMQIWQDYVDYCKDSSSRLVQTLDILRERGDVFLEHEANGCPPVLDYDYEVVLDAGTFERPCNYVLLHILPPQGITVDVNKRPYVIVDPRAGHGGGIGGFKHDSQVGVALANGHPVYFVAFKRMPEPTQTLADVCYAEAKFVNEVTERHPNAPAPVLVGNCQGGWAILILAATHPEITGPIVLNGSPVSAWSGEIGVNPMRYRAGVSGGTWMSMLASDLGNGVFDGASLVDNFEKLNPSRSYISKYYDLYKNPAINKDRFLDFERWWGGFFLMNEQEIRWIVENIFVGNGLARNTAQLESGVNIDLKSIHAPIIIFASYGDNITPPQQAVSWIMDTYSDEREIEICGQRIVYMIHEHVGHLGIFVSSSIANREHKGIATLLETIEVMPPGLYELVIEDTHGQGKQMQFDVNLAPRTFVDLAKIDNNRQDEEIFRAVHRVSKAQTQLYETYMRPMVKAMSNDITANFLRTTHPLRLKRSLWSSKNPLAKGVQNLTFTLANNAITNAEATTQNAEPLPATPMTTARANKKQMEYQTGTNPAATLPAKQPTLANNIFVQMEKLMMENLVNTLDFWRDWHGFMQESTFFTIWGMPWLRTYGQVEKSRLLQKPADLTQALAVKQALKLVDKGGFVEAVLRMIVLISKGTEGKIDDTKMAKVAKTLTEKPFNTLKEAEILAIMRQQTIIVRFEEQQALDTLPKLLKTAEEKRKALHILNTILDNPETLSQHLQAILAKITHTLKV